MKKIAIAIISLFFVLALIDYAIQSPWGKEKALSLLTEELKESGWRVNVENIRSTFPKIDFQNAIIENDELAITFGTLKADLSLLRLLKKEIFFTEVTGDRIHWTKKETLAGAPQSPSPSSPSPSFALHIETFAFSNVAAYPEFLLDIKGSFSLKHLRKKGLQIRCDGTIHPHSSNEWLAQDLRFSSHLLQNLDQTWSIEKGKIETDTYSIKGFGNLDANGAIAAATFQVQSDQLVFPKPLSLSGRLFAHVDLHRKEDALVGKTTWRIPNLEVENLGFETTQGSIDSIYANGSLSGNATISAEFLKNLWDGKTAFSWTNGGSLVLSNISVSSPLLKAEGNLAISPEAVFTGEAQFSTPQIHDLYSPLYGSAEGKILWKSVEETPIVNFDFQAKDVFFGSLSAKGVRLYSDLTNPLGNMEGTILCDIEQGKWGTLILDSASIETTKEGGNWPFQILADGTWQHPLDCEINGFWNYQQNNLLISLQNTTGSFFNHPLVLEGPANFEWTPTLFRLTDFTLNVAGGSIILNIDRQGADATGKLSIHKLPIDFLSINPLDVAIDGVFNVDVAVKEKDHELNGDLTASIENMEMLLLGQTEPLKASGALDGRFNRDQLNIKGSLNVRETPLLKADLSLPIHFSIWPFETTLLTDKNVKGHLYLSGKLEEFLDFFNLGMHRIEGDCVCDLALSNTLDHPHLQGTCDFIDAYYQNYYTGTELQNIQAHLQADKSIVTLAALTAQDSQKKGAFTAKGKMELLPKEHFPFQLDASFTRFNCVTFDLVTTEADGSIQITGNLEGALAKGHLDILETDVNVPTRIPRSLPDLQVTYKNAKAPPKTWEAPQNTAFPLALDLTVNAPDGIFISGRGLESEWKGNFHIQGTQTNIASTGKIELIKGSFLFSGREFKLTEGSLSFSGVENAMPTLNLAANIDIKDISVTAHLKGPLNNPQVTLQSSPPLPMGTIMAYLLFGQDLADISSSQALLLANSVASLAGEGPGILEQTRKSIGVDRIQIITVPSSSAQGGETIAVQVGKYVAEGVLVSFSQGADNSSTNISIEVEMKGGITFLAESDQAQEQGKFSFRWAKTY